MMQSMSTVEILFQSFQGRQTGHSHLMKATNYCIDEKFEVVFLNNPTLNVSFGSTISIDIIPSRIHVIPRLQ